VTTIETLLTTLVVLNGVCVSAIFPLLYRMHGRLSVIEANIVTGVHGDISALRSRVDRDSDLVRQHDSRITALEVKAGVEKHSKHSERG